VRAGNDDAEPRAGTLPTVPAAARRDPYPIRTGHATAGESHCVAADTRWKSVNPARSGRIFPTRRAGRSNQHMKRNILKYGVIAGLVVAACMWATLLVFGGNMPHGVSGMALGYLGMLVAFSAVFFAIRRYRDVERGGTVGFWPALGLGLGVSAVAGVFYVLAWELAQATVVGDFAGQYAASALAQAKADGADAAALAELGAQMASFKQLYANPLFRLPMTLVEIFPVGVLVSLVAAVVLRRGTPRGAGAVGATGL